MAPDFLKYNEKLFLLENEPTNKNKKSLKGLTKNVLVNKFSYILKSQLKLHALDEKQFKYINDLVFDKSYENAMKRERLRRKLMNEISMSLDKKTLKYKDKRVR